MEKEQLISYVQTVCGLNDAILSYMVDDLDNYDAYTNTKPYDNIIWVLDAGEGVDEEIVIEKIQEYLVPSEPTNEPLKFTSSAGQTLGLKVVDNSSEGYEIPGYHPNLEISFDESNWEAWNGQVVEDEEGDEYYEFNPILFSEHPVIYVRGNNPEKFSYASNDNIDIECSFQFSDGVIAVNCEGNVMSLLGEYVTEIPCDGCFAYMFRECSSLTSAPELPATQLTKYCYYFMFYGCISLTLAPELPATELVEGCYYFMFCECTSLTTAPELPATELTEYCYGNMFTGCTSLNSVKCDAIDISAANCLEDWLSGVSNTGTFTKKAGVTYPSYGSGIPSGWTIIEV